MRDQHGSDSDPHGNDAPSVERRCEQIISKRHLVGGEITRGEREVSCHNLMGEKGKTRPGKSLSEPEPV